MSNLPKRHLLMGAPALAALVLTGGVLLTSCNEHPAEYVASSGAIDIIIPTPISQSTEMDILWVIDNSGSMCQEQRVLRDNFRGFIQELAKTSLNFHIGITTTHTISYDVNTGQPLPYALEPLAQEAQLQAKPQPVPGRSSSCWHSDESNPNFDLVAQTLEFVKTSCLKDGESFPHDWSTAQYRCAIAEEPAGCKDDPSIAVDTTGDGFFDAYDLFPQPSQYRPIPKVLTFDYYEVKDANGMGTGALDVAQLERDFSCASLVGTRGSGIEKGLQVAVKAVSPDLTGQGKPNEGFVREGAGLALIFVTDENDCTHNGELNERSTCGGNVCEYANHLDAADSPLLDPAVLADEFVEKLGESKGRTVGLNEILMASIHGRSVRYTGPTPQMCTGADIFPSATAHVQPTCSSVELGTAFSGDRYERFLRQFENFYPNLLDRNDPSETMQPWMCDGNFAPALLAIGEFINKVQPGCITQAPMPCDTPGDTSECPAYPITGQPGTCLAIGSSGQNFCDSSVQVRIKPGANPGQPLENTGYCVPESIGDSSLDGGCVVARDKYTFGFDSCGEGTSNFRVVWEDEPNARAALAGYTMEIRYAPAIVEPIDDGMSMMSQQ